MGLAAVGVWTTEGRRTARVANATTELGQLVITSFFQDLERFRGGEAGSKSCQFSQAYVIAHEVGHHVQNLLGIQGAASAAKSRQSRSQANQFQVRVELQARIVWPAYGRITRRKPGTSLNPATWRRRC